MSGVSIWLSRCARDKQPHTVCQVFFMYMSGMYFFIYRNIYICVCVCVRTYAFMYMSMHIRYVYMCLCDNGTYCLPLFCMIMYILEMDCEARKNFFLKKNKVKQFEISYFI